MNLQAVRPEVKGNQDTGLLKMIALLCMITDHAGVIFFSGITEFRIIGRIAFPLYAWCLAVGLSKTRNPLKYAFRLFLMGIISQPFYMLALNHRLYELNIMFTLCIALLGMIGIQQRKNGSQWWAPAAAILLGCIIKVDYGWKGIMLPVLLYMTIENRKSIAAAFVAFCLFWGSNSSVVYSFLGIPLPLKSSFLPYGSSFLMSIFRLQFWAFLALPLILIKREKKTAFPKWAGYLAYPGHLVILYILRLILNV